METPNDQLVTELAWAARRLVDEYGKTKRVLQLDVADFREVFTPIAAKYLKGKE